MKGLRYTVLIVLLSLATYLFAGSYRVTASLLNVRNEASTDATVLYKLQQGEIIDGEAVGDWIRLERNGIEGFAYSQYLEPVETSVTVEYKETKSFSLPSGRYYRWLLYLAMILIALISILKKLSFKSIIGLIFLTVLVFILFPAIGKFLLGLIGFPKLGYYIGCGIAVISYGGMLNELFSNNKDKSNGLNNTEYIDQPDYNYSNGHDYEVSQNNYTDYQDEDYDEDHHNNNNDERLRRQEEELEEEKRKKREEMWEDNNNKAIEWERKYEYYRDKAGEAKTNAETQLGFAKDYYNKERQTDDDYYKGIYYNQAKDCESRAVSYTDDYNKYKNLENEAYREYKRYEEEAKRYRR